MTGKYLVSGALVIAIAAAFTGGASWWRDRAAAQEALTGQAVQAAIQQTFVDYREASIADDGATATALLSSESRAYFNDIHQETLNADERRLDQLDPVRRLLVVSLRALVGIQKQDLFQYKPEDLAALAFEAGIIGQDLDVTHELDVAIVQGNRATGRLRSGEHVFERREWFYQDTDGWHYDILPVFAGWSESLEERARELGVDASLVVDMTVEAFLKTTIEPAVFGKPKPTTLTDSTDSGVFN